MSTPSHHPTAGVTRLIVRKGQRSNKFCPAPPFPEFSVKHHIPEDDETAVIHFNFSSDTGRRINVIAAARKQTPEAYLANLLRVAIAADFLACQKFTVPTE